MIPMQVDSEGSAAPVARAVLRDGVYDRILDMLLENVLEPGARLSIDALARRLAVSPTPVREALANLEHTGLVTREALRGYRVAPPLNGEQLDNLVDVRLIVETGALQRAFAGQPEFARDLRAAHDADIEVVERLGLRHPNRNLDLADYRAYFEVDWGFHRVILHHSRNAYLERVGESLSFQVHRMRQTYADRVIDADDAVAEHGAILAAVEASDLPAAEAALEHHLQRVRHRTAAGSGVPTAARNGVPTATPA